MPDLIVRPTLKFIYAGYVACALLIVAAFVLQQTEVQQGPWWSPLALVVIFVWPLSRHLRILTTKVTITADRLRYETGALSKSTRTIQLAKVQDVRVDQTFGQRIFGVGNIAIETAGESSRLVILNVDRPQEIADEIMRRSEGYPATASRV